MGKNLNSKQINGWNKLARGLWRIVWLILARPSPRILHGWRAFLLAMFGAKLGKSVHVYPTANIWAPWNLEIGDNGCIADYVDCYCVDRVTLGAGATVSQYCYLCTASHDYTDPSMPLVTAPIEIGKSAWITADVFIGPGVTVGEGSVVTARSSVFSNIEPWVVARGNPAKAVKPRLAVSDLSLTD